MDATKKVLCIVNITVPKGEKADMSPLYAIANVPGTELDNFI
jgi:hypothetical protein